MSVTDSRSAPVVLTGEGRRWLEDRLAGAEARLERVAGDLEADRTPELLGERQSLQEQIDELTAALRGAVSPAEVAEDPDVVEVGDEIEVEFPDRSVETLQVVHPLEAGLDEWRVAADSPLAQAVLGHGAGERVTVTAPGGVYSCRILERRRLV